MKVITLISIQLLLNFFTLSAGEITYGFEFNLHSAYLDDAWFYRGRQTPTKADEFLEAKKFSDALYEKCKPDCIRREHLGKFSFKEWFFEFSNGLKFNISVDPATIEIQVGPYTLNEWRYYESSIQLWIFDFGAAQGFYLESGSLEEEIAHLNIGVHSAFGDDARALARYLADYWQYDELGRYVLGKDSFGAKPFSALSDQSQQNAKAILESTNDKKISIEELASEINHQVYDRSKNIAGISDEIKYQAISLYYVENPYLLHTYGNELKDVPLEMRSNRHPRSAHEAILQLELQESRIKYLRKSLKQKVEFNFSRVSGLTSAEVLYTYLGDMGMESRFDEFSVLLRSIQKAPTGEYLHLHKEAYFRSPFLRQIAQEARRSNRPNECLKLFQTILLLTY